MSKIKQKEAFWNRKIISIETVELIGRSILYISAIALIGYGVYNFYSLDLANLSFS